MPRSSNFVKFNYAFVPRTIAMCPSDSGDAFISWRNVTVNLSCRRPSAPDQRRESASIFSPRQCEERSAGSLEGSMSEPLLPLGAGGNDTSGGGEAEGGLREESPRFSLRGVHLEVRPGEVNIASHDALATLEFYSVLALSAWSRHRKRLGASRPFWSACAQSN